MERHYKTDRSKDQCEKQAIRLIVSWVLVVVWAMLIFFMSAHTGHDLDSGNGIAAIIRRWLNDIQEHFLGTNFDLVSPVAHFLEYAVFGALTCWALKYSGMKRKSFLLALMICAVYAITDEFHQSFVPGRACDPCS